MRSRLAALVAVALVAGLFPLAGASWAQVTDPEDIPAGRETEAVVLTGASFPEWATLGDIALKGNSAEGAQCLAEENGFPDGIPDSPVTGSDPCSHNQYEDPDVQSSDFMMNSGVPVDRLLGYRWNGTGFEQIPFQVDEMFIHYLSNNNSGFAMYSETDQHTTYAFDREGFRWTGEDPNNPCLAQPESEVAADPVPGLDTDDELVFMARDAGGSAPQDAPLPRGIEDSYQVAIGDPTNPGAPSFVYLMKAAEDGPRAAFDATNGYVRYERDADSNVFLFSESSYDNYGATEHGPWYDPATGVCHSAEPEWKQHRPGDQATISTPRYRFRYEGRWLMTGLEISASDEGDWTYGPDIVDQWKARAFQQRPGGQTPCCGYEEEVNNWGGSSILMGERSGPVRTIRETWGADSGTNVVRREIFYRDEIRLISFLRVHVIPPGDGIYAQWDYNAGMVSTYYNPENPDGVAIDGKNDEEVFGNDRVYIGQDGISYDPNESGDPVVVGNPGESCPNDACINNDVDSPDPTHSGPNAGLNWEQVTGDNGTLVSRIQIKQVTGGSAYSAVAVPYYRDDACFDDGTGSNPGPHLHGRGVDDGEYAMHNGVERKCWEPSDGTPPAEGDPRFFQGSIGTHGVHILLIADSDNAHTTVPVTEIDSDQRIVVLPPTLENVGERYGRQPEKPLVIAAGPEARPTTPAPAETSLTLVGDTSGQVTDETTLAARLTADNGPVAGKEIAFTLRGEPVGSATTNDDGVASLTLTLGPPTGDTQQTATFAGDGGHAGSTTSGSYEVLLDDSSMDLTLSRNGDGVMATAVLSETDTSNGLEGRTVRFFWNGEEIGSSITSSDGTASFAIPKKKAKKQGSVVRADFSGDDSFAASSDEATITKDTLKRRR